MRGPRLPRRTEGTRVPPPRTAASAPDDKRSSPGGAARPLLYGLDGPFIGEANAIRGVVGDELPWDIRSAEGSLDTHGLLRIKIRGLVFKDEDGVPADLRGINDEATLRALVSCLTEGAGGSSVETVNVVTRGFRATRAGDAGIRATLDLPNPCIAPIVVILSGSEDKWFAVTGFER